MLVGVHLLKLFFQSAKPAVFLRNIYLQFLSWQPYFKFATMGSDALCSQCATERLRTLLSLLKVRRAGLTLHFIFYYFHAEMETNVVVAAWIIYMNTSFLWKLAAQ